MAEMTRWLWERLFESGGLIERLQPLGVAQEEEIQRLCEEEIAAWRARPTMRVEASLQEPLRHARNAIRERLAVGEDNRWFNPREGAYEHLALKYLNFTPDQWNDLRADFRGALCPPPHRAAADHGPRRVSAQGRGIAQGPRVVSTSIRYHAGYWEATDRSAQDGEVLSQDGIYPLV